MMSRLLSAPWLYGAAQTLCECIDPSRLGHREACDGSTMGLVTIAIQGRARAWATGLVCWSDAWAANADLCSASSSASGRSRPALYDASTNVLTLNPLSVRPHHRPSLERHFIGNGPCRSPTDLGVDTASGGGFAERRVIAFVLVGVGLGERRQRSVEDIRLAQVGRDRDPVAGTGMRARQRPAAHPSVHRQRTSIHGFDHSRSVCNVSWYAFRTYGPGFPLLPARHRRRSALPSAR
jgi:hypothetical protein